MFLHACLVFCSLSSHNSTGMMSYFRVRNLQHPGPVCVALMYLREVDTTLQHGDPFIPMKVAHWARLGAHAMRSGVERADFLLVPRTHEWD